MSKVFYDYFKSPIGFLEIVSSDTGILKCSFSDKIKSSSKNLPKIMNEAKKQLEKYFSKELLIFDLNLEIIGTKFQLTVWNELQKIPFGETISYKELAKRIGNEKAIRAVGNANGQNPISIIIPCHRVIGSNGNLRGYGGGLEKKKWLLALEASIITK